MLHDLAHYFAQFLWILANIVWAAGDFLYSDNDHPYALFDMYDDRNYVYDSDVFTLYVLHILVNRLKTNTYFVVITQHCTHAINVLD